MSSGEWSLLAEHPFDSSTKTMINVYNNNKDGFVWAFMKGMSVYPLPGTLMLDDRCTRARCCSMCWSADWRGLLSFPGQLLGSVERPDERPYCTGVSVVYAFDADSHLGNACAGSGIS